MKHQIMQTCIMEHHIMQHCIMEHQIMQTCIMGRHIMQHCILKRHIMQACVAQKCAHQTFGALDIKMVDGPIDRTTSLFRQSLITSVIVANWRTAVVIHIPSIPLCIESTGSTVVSSVILSFIMDLFGKKLYPTCT